MSARPISSSLKSAEPNVGIVNVPDRRLDKLGVINKSEKVVPAAVSLLVEDENKSSTRVLVRL